MNDTPQPSAPANTSQKTEGKTPMPAAIVPPKKMHPLKVGLLGLSIVVLLAATLIGGQKLTPASPEDVFYGALENHMSLKYIGQRYTTYLGSITHESDTY